MIEKFVPLIPPFLNVGSKGSAVRWMVQWYHQNNFLATREATSLTIEEQFEKGTKRFQESLGFEGSDVDGNFGPGTRSKAEVKLGLRFNHIPMIPGQKTYWWGDPGSSADNLKEWPMAA